MQCTDPIADLLTRIRNGQQAGIDVLSIPASKMKIGLTHVLRELGYVRDYKCIRDRKQGILKVALKYDEDGNGAIRNLKRQSRPGLRRYKNHRDIPYVKNGFGFGIYSTSQGLMTDDQCRRSHVGGEYVCSVY